MNADGVWWNKINEPGRQRLSTSRAETNRVFSVSERSTRTLRTKNKRKAKKQLAPRPEARPLRKTNREQRVTN
jgi:hypothetical protein